MFELFPASPTWEWLWCSLTSFPQCIHTYNTAPNPLPRYVSVDSITNPETILVFQLVAKLTGQNASYEDCSQCLSNCYNTTVDQVCCIVLHLSAEVLHDSSTLNVSLTARKYRNQLQLYCMFRKELSQSWRAYWMVSVWLCYKSGYMCILPHEFSQSWIMSSISHCCYIHVSLSLMTKLL